MVNIPIVLALITISILPQFIYLDRPLITENIAGLPQIFPSNALIGYDIWEERIIEAQSRILAPELGLSFDNTIRKFENLGFAVCEMPAC